MSIRGIVSIALMSVIFIVIVFKTFSLKSRFTSKFITRTAIFSSIAIILYIVPYFAFPVVFFPSFLELHFDEVPALIAGFAYGPLSASIVIILKTIAKLLLGTSISKGVGEFADLIYSFIFVLPAVFIYRKKKNIKSAIKGLSIATIIQTIGASFITSFIILKFYIYVMGFSEAYLLEVCQLVNPKITSLEWPFFFYVAIPFNIFKDIIVILITFLLYKRLHRIIDKIRV